MRNKYFLFLLYCQDLENKIIGFLKNELEKFKKILTKETSQYFMKDCDEDRNIIREAALDITLYFLRSMKQVKLANTLKGKGLMTSLSY